MSTKPNSRRGSSLDSFLEEEGVKDEFQAQAIKEVIAWQLMQAMDERKLSKNRMASLMHTSRAQLDRLLDPERDVTLTTLQRAAKVLGREIRIELV